MIARREGRAYVLQVQEATRRYTEDLLTLVQRLTGCLTTLEAERSRLRAEAQRLHTRLATRDAELSRLHKQVVALQDVNERLVEEFGQVERRSSELANLYVATYRLHWTLDRDEVITAIREIVADLLGCEEMAIFEWEDGASALSLVASVGVDPARYARIPQGAGIIGRTALTGEAYYADGSLIPPGEEHITACTPLKVDGRITGAIALFRLLGHKRRLEEGDYQLVELLSTHAAIALYSSGLQQKVLLERKSA